MLMLCQPHMHCTCTVPGSCTVLSLVLSLVCCCTWPAGGDQQHDWESGTTALGHHLLDFWTNVCLCQSLILENNPAGGLAIYQGPSPDEVALVEAGRQLGFEFTKRSQSTITLSMLGQEVQYEVLNVMEYSSERWVGCWWPLMGSRWAALKL